MFSAVLWLFKLLSLGLWLYNILVVNDVGNCGRLWDSLGDGEHIIIYMYSFQVFYSILSVAVKGLLYLKSFCMYMISS